MKRSEVNAAIRWAQALLASSGWRLPDMAYWSLDEWWANRNRLGTVRELMLGWDITDFGTGDFAHVGAVLFTLRNGSARDSTLGVPYCEKLILMQDGQHLPKHYHVFKTEDIICRSGAPLQVFLWKADKAGNELKENVHVAMDGIMREVPCGAPITVTQGNSISLTPYLAHVFGPVPGHGPVIVGEVSKVNDDRTDNYFLEPTARFADILEDEEMLVPLCNEYDRI